MEELETKIKNCKTVEELKAVGKEIGYELTDEEAQGYLEQFSKSSELTDDELSNVSGGCVKWRRGSAYSGEPPHYLITTIGNSCKLWEGPTRPGIKGTCFTCQGLYKKVGLTFYCTGRTYDNDPINPKK